MKINLRKWYVDFIEKDRRNVWESIFYCFLLILSVIYGFAVGLRNLFYDKKIIPSYKVKAKVLSIGNLSWAGSGKTPLSIWLYENLASQFNTAILRRGYGDDENKMLLDTTANVFSLPDRYKLAKSLESSFDVFILDDGFQFRRLKRDVNIVIRAGREFKKKYRLIPAYFFREPLSSLGRADIVLLNYKDEIEQPSELKKSILDEFPNLEVYFCQYKFKYFLDLDNNEFDAGVLRGRKLACFCAIGYPKGFIAGLKKLDLDIVREIIYPDHYELSQEEFMSLQDDLLQKGIKDLIITSKDRYHLPVVKFKLNIFIMEVGLKIEDQDSFLQEVVKRLV